MKKIMAVFLAMAITMAIGSSLAAVDINELRTVTEDFLKTENLNYDYDSEFDCFELTFNVDSTLTTVEATIYVYDDMVSVSVECPIRIPENKMENIAVFTTLVNNDIYYGQFRLDMNSGILRNRASNVIETVMPGADEIGVLLTMPIDYMDKYGDAIAAICSTDLDPYTAYEQVTAEE